MIGSPVVPSYLARDTTLQQVLAEVQTQQKDALTNVQLRSAPVQTLDTSDVEYTRIATTVNAAGDTLLATPSSGKRIRLHRVYAVNDPVSNSSTKITIKLGGVAQYVVWAVSQKQQVTGPVNGALVINLSQPGDVAVTITYEEI